MVWFSGAANREMRAPKGLLVAHFFNHQTHHRGQAHAMLTAAGQETGDTDLFLLIPRNRELTNRAGLALNSPGAFTTSARPFRR